SHAPELDIVYAGIAGVSTASGSGLIGGGTSGTLNLSLTNACAANQVLQYNGSSWVCAAVGTGTVTSVGSGTGLTGGPITGSGTLSLDTTKVPLLGAANTFTANQTVNGNLSATGVVSGSVAIGTTAPTHALEVSSAGATSAQMAMVSSGSDAAFSLKNTASGGREYWIDSGSGSAGVGAGNFAVYDRTAGETRLVITQAGNVGIGTTAPQYTLDVHGAGNFTGNVTFTGNQTVSGNLSATGVVSGSSFQIGSNLFAFGSYANNNVFLGFAGNTTMTGTSNTASGRGALAGNTTGNYNTASGSYSLHANTTGSNNTASGQGALFSNTTGYQNTASGQAALYANTTGNYNMASGFQALQANTTGSLNTASGSYSLQANTTGTQNTASGGEALSANTIGESNMASGFRALYVNTMGSANTA